MKKLYLLVIKDRVSYPIDLSVYREWMFRHLDIELTITERTSAVPLSFKGIGVPINGDWRNGEWWGLDGIKETLRALNFVEPWRYQQVIFFYDIASATRGPMANLTHGVPIQNAVFTEIPTQAGRTNGLDVALACSHETLHALHRLCWWRGIRTADTMDAYDKDNELEATDGNRARNIAQVMPYLTTILQPPMWWEVMRIKEAALEILRKIMAMGLGRND